MPEARVPGDEYGRLEMFSRWDRDLDAHWSDWEQEARDNYDLVAGEQWKDEVREDMESKGRVPVTFNRIGPVIDAVSGAEIQGRQQVTYLPRQVGASAVNEVLTKGAEWIRDRCDAEHEESDSALDTFICGMGWIETRLDYEEDPNGAFVISRIDPLEMRVDPRHSKRNAVDAKYLRRKRAFSRDEFEEMFPGKSPQNADDLGTKRPAIVDPSTRYTHGDDDKGTELDTVWVTEWQWYERERFYRVQHPDSGEILTLQPSAYEPIADQARGAGVELGGVQQWRRVYYKAIVGQEEILHFEKLEVGEFTYKCMTGKRDRNKGTWYGLVRPMSDPQRFANKFYSQILHILNANAKGGLIMEASAAVDQRQFEATWSAPDAITWVQDGALSGPGGKKWAEKTPPAYPQGQERLMDAAIASIRDSTGVNQELLGLAEQNQPGVLEHQRKQAAYGILSAFFDGFKRYRKLQGRLLLKFMQRYMPPNMLVRIVGDDGTAQYVPLALDDQTIEFDVIVDDAPAGPNQKDQTFQMLVQLMPLLQNANMPPEMWAEIVRYSPLPDALSEKFVQYLMQQQQQQGQPTPEQQAQLALMQSKAQNDSASAEHHSAQAKLLTVKAMREMHTPLDPNASKPQAPPENQALKDQETLSQLQLNHAKTGALLAKTASDIIRDHRPEPTSPR